MHDAIIIGGSYAGLSAAMYLARGRHDVLVVDTGTPRNRFSPASHAFFAQDGSTPADMLATARRQLAAYPTVSLLEGEALAATGSRGAFRISLASGEVVEARRIVIASGVHDILPLIEGLAERWGKSVLHCPYCHGYEFAGRRLGVLYTGEGSIHHARLIANWGPTTLFLNGCELPDPDAAHELSAHGIAIEAAPIKALRGDGGELRNVALTTGSDIGLDALYIAPRTELRGEVAGMLGCATRELAHGHALTVDERMMTTVPGVFAAGDAASAPSLVARAVADGSLAGAMVSQSLIFDT